MEAAKGEIPPWGAGRTGRGRLVLKRAFPKRGRSVAAAGLLYALIHPNAWRNCLIVPNKGHCGVPKVVKSGPTSAISLL